MAAVSATLFFLAGTHYPKLTIGVPGDGPDKLLHLTAFVVLTVLFRISGLASTIPRAIGLMTFLAIFDEVTQELPGLNRNFDPVDLVADVLGILLAAAWMKALGPPSPRDRIAADRYERVTAGLRLLLSRFMNWCHVAIAAVFGVLVGGTMLAVIGRNPVVGPVTMFVVGAIVGAFAAMIAAVEAGRRQMDQRLERDRRCLLCLDSIPAEEARCSCGGRPAMPRPDGSTNPGRRGGPREGQKGEGPSVGIPHGLVGRLTRRYPVLLPTLTIVVMVSILGVILDLLHVFTSFRIGGPGRGVVKWFGDLPVADAMAFDAAILGLIAAGTVGVLRRWSNRRLADFQSRCPACGYDLRHLDPRTEDSICPECGAPAPSAIAAERMSGDHRRAC